MLRMGAPPLGISTLLPPVGSAASPRWTGSALSGSSSGAHAESAMARVNVSDNRGTRFEGGRGMRRSVQERG